MNTRRDFIKAGTVLAAALADTKTHAQSGTKSSALSSGKGDRAYWVETAGRLAGPVLVALASRKLKLEMPVEAQAGTTDRAKYTHLEALGRLLCGIAPWLEFDADDSPEGQQRRHFAELARQGIDASTDPSSPDRMNFSEGGQPLVDAAFLAQAILRAPNELWKKLVPAVQSNVIAALKQTRSIQPPQSNWLLFATIIEVFMQHVGEKPDSERLFKGLRKFREWYLGDSIYGDGPELHWDYYDSFVIHPMLVESLDLIAEEGREWNAFRDREIARLTRFAAIQERMIAPDGSYPIVGRSIAYRCGAFQGLALAALRHSLPAEITPGQARRAMTSVIRRTLNSPGTWDANGWLRIGLSGHQPALGERYISTGSLYLCSAALLPLGLPVSDPFWSEPDARTTWEKAWSGEDLPPDHALRETSAE
jgi:hypothetical protein